MADYEIPETHEFPIIPSIMEGSMAHSSPFVAAEEFQTALGFSSGKETGDLIDGWKEKFLEVLTDKLKKYRSLQVFMDICVKCGACTDKCHYFIGTADAKNMPVARQDLLRKVYRRHFTFAGKYFPKLVGAVDLTEERVREMYSYYHQCSECRRCAVFCPFGIDTAEVTMAARDILAQIGLGQKYDNQIIAKVHQIGNNLGLPERALANTLEGLEEEVEEDTGIKVRYPLNEKGVDILLVTPSADFFAEPHVDGLIGYGKVFHEAGVTWTMSSIASEAANFGLFIGNYENMRQVALRVRDAAKDLGVKRIIFGECGHAWRVAYNFLDTLAGPWDFLDQSYPIPQHILEFTKDCLDRGILNIDKSGNDHMTITFHDSCNIARASRIGKEPGSQFTTPREVIRAVCNNYHDMAIETIYDQTFCCGGGGGLLTDDLMELRIKGALPRMEALKNVTKDHGVTHMAAICAICKSQFTKVLPYYGMTMDQIVSVHQLVSNAIILEGQDKEAEDSSDADEAA